MQDRRDHARIVEHQRIARLEQIREFIDMAVVEPLELRVHDKQTRIIARPHGPQGDQLFG